MAALPWTPFHARLHQLLRDRSLLPKGDTVLMAVSGGQDSLCLLRLLVDLQPKWGWSLAVAHCNHGWRADAADNARYVETLATQWQLPCWQVTAVDLPCNEAAARQWRYDQLLALAQTHGHRCIVTGHTASDRAETLLHNLVRGAGMTGLQALTWQRPLGDRILVRPLLQFQRADTAALCQQLHLTPWLDPSNHSRRHTRNRIRHEVLPLLATAINPQAERHLAQTAEVLRADEQCLSDLAQQLWHQVRDPQGYPQLDRRPLQTAPLALQRRVMAHYGHHITGHGMTHDHIEALLQLIHAPNRSQTSSLPGGAIAVVDHPWIVAHAPSRTPQEAASSGE
jgi:tRNA(Ile)-lysidine synthase